MNHMRHLCFRIVKTKKEVDVNFDLLWTAFTPYFDFDTDMSPVTMADAICRETWSRSYFDDLQRSGSFVCYKKLYQSRNLILIFYIFIPLHNL